MRRTTKNTNKKNLGNRLVKKNGVMLDSLPDGLEADEVAEQLGMCASRAAGYEVMVETKRIARPPAVVD